MKKFIVGFAAFYFLSATFVVWQGRSATEHTMYTRADAVSYCVRGVVSEWSVLHLPDCLKVSSLLVERRQIIAAAMYSGSQVDRGLRQARDIREDLLKLMKTAATYSVQSTIL